MMNVKSYLSQAYRIDQRINSKLEQVLSLRELASRASATLGDEQPKGTRNFNRMEDIICKIMDLESEINADIDSLVDLKREIVEFIKSVSDPEYQTVLELRYLCFKTWEQIAVDMGYSLRWVHIVHSRILSELGKQYVERRFENGLL